jgi:hypothetical protein
MRFIVDYNIKELPRGENDISKIAVESDEQRNTSGSSGIERTDVLSVSNIQTE